jgi:hypothetical protein
MKAYCEHVGIDFSPAMLQWSSGEQKHFAKWPVRLIDAIH